MKKFLVPGVIILLLVVGVLAFLFLRPKGESNQLPQTVGKKQIINALPIDQRPFVALIPHTSNRLLTLFFDKPGKGTNVSLDIEYLAGNSLKGGRTSVKDLNSLPYTAAFLLGSCSTGGKCSFDTDITTGTLKTKLEIGDELHLLKSNFVFVGKEETFTSDQKLGFKSTTPITYPMILSQTHGYLSNLDKQAAAEPVAITQASDKKIAGTLTLLVKDATGLVIYDGKSYQPLEATKTDAGFTVKLNHTPWSKTVDIVRDDDKGSTETVTLYLLGPIVPVK